MKDEDVVIKSFYEVRGSGMHVGTQEHCCKAIHLPTGLSAWGTDQRSQIKNREMAMELLRQKVKEVSDE